LKPPGDTSSSAFAIRLEETRANLRIIEEKFELFAADGGDHYLTGVWKSIAPCQMNGVVPAGAVATLQFVPSKWLPASGQEFPLAGVWYSCVPCQTNGVVPAGAVATQQFDPSN
jgi:hypothetical protein